MGSKLHLYKPWPNQTAQLASHTVSCVSIGESIALIYILTYIHMYVYIQKVYDNLYMGLSKATRSPKTGSVVCISVLHTVIYMNVRMYVQYKYIHIYVHMCVRASVCVIFCMHIPKKNYASTQITIKSETQ